MADIQRRLAELTAAQNARLEQIVEAFEAAWRQGQKPAIERFLPTDAVLRPVVLAELVHTDAEFRQAAGGGTRLDDYFARFPELAEDTEIANSLLASARERVARRFRARHAAAKGAKQSGPVKAAPGERRGATDTEEISESENSPDTDVERRPASAAEASAPGAAAQSGHALSPGTILGNYVIIRKLGEGGMGTVYLAEHSRMQRFVALKVLSSRVMLRPDAIRRFRREVQVVAKLAHENIVTAHDADEINGLNLLVMEYVEGTNLSNLVRTDGPLPLKKAVDYIVQTARGLQFAHAKGIVHRDIKPGNLMLSANGVIKILDLGLARFDETIVGSPEVTDLTDTGSLMGTIDYLAPEQARDSSSADQRSDIYSLGCTLFHLLTGKPVFAGRTLMERLLAHREQKPPSLRDERNDVSMELDSVFRTMVAKDPFERYPTMAAVLHAFEQCEFERQFSSGVHGIVAPKTDGYRVAGQPETPEPSINEPVKLPAMRPAAPPRAVSAGAPQEVPAGATKKPRHAAHAGVKRPKGAKAVAASRPSEETAAGGNGRPLPWIVGGVVSLLAIAVGVGWWAFGRAPAAPQPAVAPAQNETPKKDPGPARLEGAASSAQVGQIQQEWAEAAGVPREQKNSVGMTLVLIPPGTYRRGTPPSEMKELVRTTEDASVKARFESEGPQHPVKISELFFCSAHEVTQAQYERVMGANPASFSGSGEKAAAADPATAALRPVEQVSWYDALAFCNQLSAMEKLRPCYSISGKIANLLDGDGYRLPTEAEWEFLCRAGTEDTFDPAGADSLAQFAWHNANSGGSTHPVGKLKPNAFGLFDTHGNVLEWCYDWYDATSYRAAASGASAEPVSSGAERVIRGGCWNDEPVDCRCASRSMFTPDFRNDSIGFRVVRAARPRR